jgi:hypothetical protein
MRIRVISKSKHELPDYSTETSAGMDESLADTKRGNGGFGHTGKKQV